MLYFSDEGYKNIALSLSNNDMDVHNYIDAFFLLIKDMEYSDLDNLCNKISMKYSSLFGDSINKDKCYQLTQRVDLDDDLKKIIYECAEELINEGNFLGTKVSNGFNMTAWLNHCYYVGECCANLANIIGIDSDKARTYGMLHDIGRKKSQKFDHAIYGFEYLVSIGFVDEAIGCLTHSFVNGGRCSNNERAIDGFYVDNDGNARFRDGSKKDDITLFLEQYKYNDYDLILNIADLMAVNKGIVSPYDRIQDIATRRELDPVNRGYFLADITNVFIDVLKRVGYVDKDLAYIKATKDTSLGEIEKYFKEISQDFYEAYVKLNQPKKNSKK